MKTTTARQAKYKTTHSQGGWSIEVYKGYLIQPGLGGEMFYVQKGGFTIASCLTPDAARQAIDSVVG